MGDLGDFESLEQALASPQPDDRQRAVVGLVETADLRALPLLERAAKADPNTKVRFYAKRGILLLRQRASPESGAAGAGGDGKQAARRLPDLRVLVSRWRTLSVGDRIRAIQHLIALGNAQLLPFYTALLKLEKEPFVRSKLAVALGILGEPAGLPVLKGLLTDPDARVRSNAAEAIGYVGGEAALQLLFAALVAQETPRLVQNVQRFLDRGNEPLFAQYLDKVLASDRAPVREAAVRAIAVLGRERLLDVLGASARKGPGPAAEHARAALERLAAAGNRRARALLDRLSAGPDNADDAGEPGSGQSGLVIRVAGASESERIEKLTAVIASGDRQMLPHLAAWLRAEKSGKVRSLLVRGIAGLAGDRAVKTLLGLLDDPDPRVRADAIESLYPFATDPEVARLVPKKLADPTGRVRANALVLLGRIPGTDLQKPLGELANSPDPEDRLRAIYVVSDVERDDATLLVAPLLADEDPKVRARAAETLHMLAERGNTTAMKLLAGSAPAPAPPIQIDPEEEESAPAAAPPPSPVAGPPRAAVPRPAPVARRPSGALRADPGSDEVIEQDRLLYMLESEDEKERVEALRILEEIGDEKALGPVQKLTSDRSEEVRQHAAWTFRALKERHGAEGAEPIPDAGEDEVERLRLRLCHREAKIRHQALREIGPAHRELAEFLLDRIPLETDSHVKASMVLVAGMLAAPRDAHRLVACLKDEDARVRANAIEALEYAGDVNAMRVIAPYVTDLAPRIRANAAKALKNYDRTKVLAVLTNMTRSKDGWQRAAAVGALDELGGPDILKPLYELLESEENLYLSVIALAAVCRVKDPGRKPALAKLEAAATDEKKKDWIGRAVAALDGSEFKMDLVGAEGHAGRLKPSVEELMASLSPKRTSGVVAVADDEKSLERQKLARMAAHLRDDLYARDSKVRQEAAIKLARVEHPAAIRAL
ncbi:MAG: HEAT repeat domain-containing protein, partial [Candidatus Wallbacteria bacterium]|nr:HEAT repeat domain-containing protein [Candidatus Wallbacteria bacterium]